MIVQLHNFIKVRDDLIKHTQIAEVDKHLEPSWKPIIELREPIKQLRNQYIAHIQEKNRRFKKPIQEIIEQYNVPTLFGEWLFRIGCCLVYCKGISSNFSSEWDDALAKYHNSQPLPTQKGTITISNAPIKVQEVLSLVLENLNRNKFKKLSKN